MHAKKSAVIEATTKACRWILIILLPLDFAFTVALMVQPQSSSDTTFEQSEDLNYAVVRLATSSITAILSVVSLLIAIPRYKLLITRRMIVLFSLRIVSVILLVPELSYPTPTRTALNVIVLLLILFQLIVISIVFVRISKVNREFYGRKERESSVGALLREVRKDPTHFVDALDEWLLLKDSRKLLRRKYHVAQTGWTLASSAVMLISFVIFVTEFAKIASTQDTLYSSTVIGDMNSPNRISYYNYTHPQQKALVVVLDGMRYDYLNVNSEMSQFLNSPEIAPHAKVFKMHAQLPSMSVPNWVTILTGAPPEATGVLGNLLVPETKFDSMFREAANFNLERGLTGSPWFSAIIDSTLPFLGGDGTIPTSLGANGKETSDIADDERANVCHTALSANYDLFLAHFSDVDIQGHCCGVSKDWNEQNTYYEAATNKSVLLTKIYDWLDEDTVMFVVADHGHIDRGGHGGVDKKLIEVPLVIFKKNSYLANRTFTGARFKPVPTNYDFDEDSEAYYTNFDVSPTVCAMLGIPVPRQNHGKFIDDVMVLVNESALQQTYYDLYKQKEAFVEAFITTSQVTSPPKLPNLGPNLTVAEYVDAIESLIDTRDNLRSKTMTREQARNIIITTVICVGVGVCLLFLMQHVTFCTPMSIFSRQTSVVRRKNRLAALWGFLTVLFYYGFGILIYYIAFLIVGYHKWDSTVIHYPEVLTRYAAITLVPVIIIIYVVVRAIHIYYSILPPFNRHNISLSANPILLGRNPVLKDVGFIFLYRYYLSWWTVVTWLILLIMQSSYTFVIPPVFSIHYITAGLWVFRFRILTVQLMSLPLSFCCIVLLYFGLPSRNANKQHFDQIYLLKITKDLLRAGHTKPLENLSEDLTGEDSILQKHKNSIYYTAILEEIAMHRFNQVHTIYDVTNVTGNVKATSTELQKLEDFVISGTVSVENKL